MSPPDTNIETEEKRHKPALVGIGVAVGFAAILLLILAVAIANRGGTPEGADTEIDGRTGAVES